MIWCVEDDENIREIEIYTLNSTGFEAIGFSDGLQFWKAIQKEIRWNWKIFQSLWQRQEVLNMKKFRRWI